MSYSTYVTPAQIRAAAKDLERGLLPYAPAPRLAELLRIDAAAAEAQGVDLALEGWLSTYTSDCARRIADALIDHMPHPAREAARHMMMTPVAAS